MTNVIQNSSKAQVQTLEKGSNPKLVKVQKNNLIVTSLQASTKNGSEKQLQKSLEAPKVEVPVNTSQAIRVPYRDSNHKIHYDRQKNQKENYQYYFYKEKRQNLQLPTIDPKIIPLRVYLGWTTSQMTQHFHTMFKRMYHLISSNVATTNTQCHEKA